MLLDIVERSLALRDGIFKSLSIPRRWKSVLRACEREAEREDVLVRLIERALEGDAHKEITPKFLNQFRKILRLDESSLPGIGLFVHIEHSRDIGGKNMALENSLLAYAKGLEGVLRGDALAVEVLKRALQDRGQSMFRDIQTRCVGEEGASELLSPLQKAMSQAPLEDLADRVIKGKRPLKGPIRLPIDLDLDDLSV